jgi:hypothetical protein
MGRAFGPLAAASATTGLSVQGHSSTNNEIKNRHCSAQNLTELIEAVSEEDKIMVITKMVLSLMKQNGY